MRGLDGCPVLEDTSGSLTRLRLSRYAAKTERQGRRLLPLPVRGDERLARRAALGRDRLQGLSLGAGEAVLGGGELLHLMRKPQRLG